MFISISATLATIGKKILAVLAGDKKGRKFLGYVIGITLFIVLLPVIALYGLFGWMSGGGGLDSALIENAIPVEYCEQFEQYNEQLLKIESTFSNKGLTEIQINQAKIIYLSCLIGKENEENFYQKLAECFQNASAEKPLLDCISETFGVTFSDSDKEEFNKIYGGSVKD